MWLLAYVASVAIANIITAATHPLSFVGLLVPWGTFFIGITLLLRNMVQVRRGRAYVYLAIGLGLVVSAFSSYFLGNAVPITLASAVSFLISESLDTEVFSRLRRRSAYVRVLTGGGVGGVLDSVIFITLGLSPWGADFVPWSAVPMAILGQLLVKVAMQALGGIAAARVIERMKLTGRKTGKLA